MLLLSFEDRDATVTRFVPKHEGNESFPLQTFLSHHNLPWLAQISKLTNKRRKKKREGEEKEISYKTPISLECQLHQENS